ncbi:MAG: AI-2E family transporter [Blastochloris sp.]|nr:AI-2E family transporter [Blastochloris sp.]
MNGPNSQQEKIIWQALSALSLLFIAALGLGAFYLLIETAVFLKAVLVPLALAAVVAYLLHPVIQWLESLGMKRTRGIFLLFAVVGTILMVASVLLIPRLYTETAGLIRDIPTFKEKIEFQSATWLQDHPDVVAKLHELEAQFQTELPKYNAKIASWVWAGVGNVFSTLGLILGLVFIPLYVFYFLREQPHIQSRWHEYIPLHRSRLRDEIVVIIAEINKHMITFFRGQVIVALILGTMTGIGLSLFGLKYALLIGVISATFSIIPYLGVIISVVPALLIAFTQSGGSPGYLALIAGVFVVVQVCEGTFISPKIMGDRTGLHPLTIIISILVWSIVLGGLLGAILAIPLTATLKVLMYRYIWQEPVQPEAEAAADS